MQIQKAGIVIFSEIITSYFTSTWAIESFDTRKNSYVTIHKNALNCTKELLTQTAFPNNLLRIPTSAVTIALGEVD